MPFTECVDGPSASRYVEVKGNRVLVTAESNVSEHQLDLAITSVPFRNWISKLEAQSEHFTLHNAIVQSVDLFGSRIGFVKLKSEVTDKDGDPVPGIVFLRGGSVAVLVVLQCAETGKQHCLQVRLNSVPAVLPMNMTLPAGMLDGSGDFVGAMAREMEEETGIKCESTDLVDMTAMAYGDKFEGMYPSVGGSDEFIRLFLYKRIMPADQIKELNGKLAGKKKEMEKIALCLVPLDDLWKMSSDAKALSALFLYEKLGLSGAALA